MSACTAAWSLRLGSRVHCLIDQHPQVGNQTRGSCPLARDGVLLVDLHPPEQASQEVDRCVLDPLPWGVFAGFKEQPQGASDQECRQQKKDG